MDPALYDAEYADRTEDLRWYRAQARQRLDRGGRILELGAGSGRITCGLARSGYHVVALDRMPAMLDGLRAKIEGKKIAERIDVVHADMREIPLPTASVAMAIAPFNALMHLYTSRDLLACLREVRRVLWDGGTFAFDVHLPDPKWLQLDPKKRHGAFRFKHPTTGESLVWSTNHRYDRVTQVCHINIYYDAAPPRGEPFVAPRRARKRVRLAHRQIYPEELRQLLQASGLTLVALVADFTRQPLHGRAVSQCVVCAA